MLNHYILLCPQRITRLCTKMNLYKELNIFGGLEPNQKKLTISGARFSVNIGNKF